VFVAKDFRTIAVQATVFTPGIQFRAPKVFAHLQAKFGDEFDGEPQLLPMGGANIPLDIPQILLKSADEKIRLQAGSGRVDLFKSGDHLRGQAVGAFLTWATEVFAEYLTSTAGKVGRVACVLHRVVSDPAPAKTLAHHFCQERWLASDGPINRPSDFELHTHKRFRLPDLFEINSWFRCKTAIEKPTEGEPSASANLIVVQQDFNSPAEEEQTRELTNEQVSRFFEVSIVEFDKVLDRYFPSRG
jgi:hypothetical protein